MIYLIILIIAVLIILRFYPGRDSAATHHVGPFDHLPEPLRSHAPHIVESLREQLLNKNLKLQQIQRQVKQINNLGDQVPLDLAVEHDDTQQEILELERKIDALTQPYTQ